MKYIVDSYPVKFEEIYFLDDQVSHLIRVRNLGVQVFLAGWSYATKQQKQIVNSLKIPIIEKENQFLPTFKKFFS